jgi:hypothetical protein
MLCGSPETITRVMRAYTASGVEQMLTAFLSRNRAHAQARLRLVPGEIMPNVAR